MCSGGCDAVTVGREGNGCGHATGLQEVGKRILKERDGPSLTARKDRRKNKEKEASSEVLVWCD